MNVVAVVVPHTESGLRPETVAAVNDQAPYARFHLTHTRQPWSYADMLRRLWREGSTFLLCEQDVVPPADSLRQLAACSRPWCTHPISLGDHLDWRTFGLVKLSGNLSYGYPFLMDALCTPLDPRYWVRRGWTDVSRDCSPAVLNRRGRKACLRPDAPVAFALGHVSARPSSCPSHSLDVLLARELAVLGIGPHVHEQPAMHLRDYVAHPAGVRKEWWEVPYETLDWPD